MAPDLQKEAVYGLTEVNRDQICKGRLIANPGCYPTSVLLPLSPLLEKNLIQKEGVFIDAKSGSAATCIIILIDLKLSILTNINLSYGTKLHTDHPKPMLFTCWTPPSCTCHMQGEYPKCGIFNQESG